MGVQFSFGCVLYEMLTGKAAFQGEDVTEILAAVVKSEVNLELLPANIHPRMREVLIRCLQKDMRRRYTGIGDARYEIEQVLADPNGVFSHSVQAVAPQARLRTTPSWVAVTAILRLIIAGVAVWYLKPPPSPEPKRVVRFEYDLPEDQQITGLDVSPDGRQFVYSTTKGLFIRSVDELTARLIAGTEGITVYPFFSPDGKYIGYFARNEHSLKKVAISGGTPVTFLENFTRTEGTSPSWDISSDRQAIPGGKTARNAGCSTPGVRPAQNGCRTQLARRAEATGAGAVSECTLKPIEQHRQGYGVRCA